MQITRPLLAAADSATAATEDSTAMSAWMKGLPSLDTEPAAAATREEPNVSPTPAKSGGDPAPAASTAPAPDKSTANKPDPAKPAAAAEPKTEPDGGVTKLAKPAEPVEEKWPRTSADWDRFKAVRKEREAALQKEIDIREAKIKEIEKKTGELEQKASKADQVQIDHAQVERLKAENEELSKRLQVIDVTQHPKFQAYFDNKINSKVNLAKKIVGTEKAEMAEKVLKMPDSEEFREIKQARIEELIADLDPLAQGRFADVLNSLDEINEERANEIQKANEHRAQLESQKKDTTAKAAQNAEKLFTDTLKKLQTDKDEGMALYQVRDGDDEWNSRVGQNIDVAKKLIFGQGTSPETIIRAALHAAALPTLLQSYKATVAAKDSEIQKLSAQVKQLTAAQPAPGAGTTNGEQSGRVQFKPDMNPMEAGRAWAESMRQAMSE